MPGEESLGPCCICEAPGATVILMLNARCVVPGHGWGCVACGLSQNGAMAVVCEPCAQVHEQLSACPCQIEDTLRFVCRGYPGTEGRMPIEQLRGEHGHDFTKHPEAPRSFIPALTVLGTDRRFPSHVEEGQGCLCSRCGATIWEGTVSIRSFSERGQWQYRYHSTCFGVLPLEEDPYQGDDYESGDSPGDDAHEKDDLCNA